MKKMKLIILSICFMLVGCDNSELSSIDNVTLTKGKTDIARSLVNDYTSTLSTDTDLPDVQVSCTNHCLTPIVVTFTAPNYAQIGNANPYTISKTITPLFVYNDQFYVRATIQHGCSSKHTLKITNTWGYEETLVSGSQIGTYEYTGYIPLSHKDLERISVQLIN